MLSERAVIQSEQVLFPKFWLKGKIGTFKMDKGRIRIRLKSYDHRVIDDAAVKIIETALMSGAKIAGPIPLPTKRKLIVVNTSPHTDKDSRDQFEILTHCRLIDITQPTPKTVESLQHMELPAGVDIEIRM